MRHFEADFKLGKQKTGQSRIKLTDLETHLSLCFESFPKTFIFIDAINESCQSAAIASSLVRLSKSAKNLYVFLTSTEEAVTDHFEGDANLIKVSLQSQAVVKDVKVFVEASLEENPSLRDLKDDLKAEIRTTLIREAQGMYGFRFP